VTDVRLSRFHHRVVAWIGWISGRRWFARVAPHVFPPLDRWVNRISGGRRFLSELFVPIILVTTTGARSGEPRSTPLACVPVGSDVFLVVGSNYGGERHPAWTGNLLAHPDATVTTGGRAIPVRAELLAGDERAAAWTTLVTTYPPWDAYARKTRRELRVFRLVPVDTP
jgi:deazaflavin-dependent oxidoreductase (nitroreductase family)